MSGNSNIIKNYFLYRKTLFTDNNELFTTINNILYEKVSK